MRTEIGRSRSKENEFLFLNAAIYGMAFNYASRNRISSICPRAGSNYYYVSHMKREFNLILLFLFFGIFPVCSQVRIPNVNSESLYEKVNFDVIVEFNSIIDSNQIYAKELLSYNKSNPIKKILVKCENSIREIPNSFFELNQLEKLTIECSNLLSESIDTLSVEINSLLKLKELRLENVPILHFDSNIKFDSLLVFAMNNFKCKEIPQFIYSCHSLEELHLKDCKMNAVTSLKANYFPHLKRITLTGIPINTFPEFILNLKGLVYIDVSDCPISRIPLRILDLSDLQVLIFGSINQLLKSEPKCPAQVFTMPCLQRVSAAPSLLESNNNSKVNWTLDGEFFFKK